MQGIQTGHTMRHWIMMVKANQHFRFQSAYNQVRWIEWGIVSIVFRKKITVDIWEMAGEGVR